MGEDGLCPACILVGDDDQPRKYLEATLYDVEVIFEDFAPQESKQWIEEIHIPEYNICINEKHAFFDIHSRNEQGKNRRKIKLPEDKVVELYKVLQIQKT